MLSFALNTHYVYSLLFLQFYAHLFFLSQNPLVVIGKGQLKYIIFMASGRPWFLLIFLYLEHSRGLLLEKKLFQSLHLHWMFFFKPSRLWPSSYESARSASRWYCKSHILKRLNLWQWSVWTFTCLSLNSPVILGSISQCQLEKSRSHTDVLMLSPPM